MRRYGGEERVALFKTTRTKTNTFPCQNNEVLRAESFS